jgi:hypothetical protein
MEQRKIEHERKITEFIDKIGKEIQSRIVEDARSELKKDENKKKVREAEEKRKAILQAKLAADKKAGIEQPTGEEGDESGWSRGVKKAEIRRPEDSKEKVGGSSGFLSRGAMGTQKVEAPAEPKKDEAKGPPRFFNKNKQEDKKEDATGF